MDKTIVEQSIEQVMEYVKAGADLAAEQMPLVAQEIVAREIALNALGVFVGLLFVSVGAWLVRAGVKRSKDSGTVGDGFEFWGPGVCCFAIGFIPFLVALCDLIAALIAPRVLVLEKLASLL